MRDPWYLINYGSNANEFRTYDYLILEIRGNPWKSTIVVVEWFQQWLRINPMLPLFRCLIDKTAYHSGVKASESKYLEYRKRCIVINI